MHVSDLGYNYGRISVLLPGEHTFEAGEIIRLTGRNGCGKSTILQVLARVLDGYTGTCDYPRPWVARYIPTNVSAKLFLPWYTVERNIELLLGNKEPHLKARELVRTFLGPSSDRLLAQPAYTPSAGEAAAIAVACAIATKPMALLLDETLSFAAPGLARELARRLECLLKAGGLVFIAGHHDLPFGCAVREIAMRDPDEKDR
jgi:ABC-type branched-subunit amino acid transport system ATPase component